MKHTIDDLYGPLSGVKPLHPRGGRHNKTEGTGNCLTVRSSTVIGLVILLTTVTMLAAGEQDKPRAPVILSAADGRPPLVAMPDGGLSMIFARKTPSGMEVTCKRTTDNGRSWSAPETLCTMISKEFGTKSAWLMPPLLSRDGRLQLFWMVERGSGHRDGVDYFIDVVHAHSLQSLTAWSPPQRIFEGYVGSINGVTQLKSGRIVLPFAYWLAGVAQGPPFGSNATTSVYSDDHGDTWNRSPAKLIAPCYTGYNGGGCGAIEPTILELNDGRVWMLIRTQTGLLYESFSTDGANWSDAKPTRFYSSDSPAWLMRLPDKRIVLLWNNCENTSRIDGEGVYTTRDALHAAISSDEGATWRGYREVYLDPLRNQSPPKEGDRGTAYPYAAAASDGNILMISGQGDGRQNIVSIDPDWLEETHHEDDFSHGLGGWSVFKSFGPATGWWRDRVQGPQLVNHPTKSGVKVLHICRPDEKDGDEAVWNFPVGRKGKVELSLLLKPGSQGVSLALADRYIQPSDGVGDEKVLFCLPIGTDGRVISGTSVLNKGRWHTFTMNWEMDEHLCRVLVDGQPAGVLTMRNADSASPGPSYLRLRSTAQQTDTAGMLVEWVRARSSSPPTADDDPTCTYSNY